MAENINMDNNPTDSERVQRKRRADEWEGASSSKKSAPGQQNTSGGGGGSAGGGMGGDPEQMMHAQHTNAIDKYTMKVGGTTFVGAGATGVAGEDNTWFRFPWETVLDKISDWSAIEVGQKWMYWKATKIHIQFKNPMCIQDIGTATAGLVSAGQNLHASLFGYVDDLYQLGLDEPYETYTEADMTALIRSWRNHGYENGLPIILKDKTVGDGGGTFQNNYPDVKQCGMGNAHKLDFSWNIHSPFWRSTDELIARPTVGGIAGAKGPLMGRWDEKLGAISTSSRNTSFRYWMGDVNNPTVASLVRSQWIKYPDTPATFTLDRMPWVYRDPNPIPGLYLQLQPQIGSIATGVSESVCQLQFELSIELACRGRLPRMGMDRQSMTAAPSYDAKVNGQNFKANRQVPIFVPMIELETAIA